MLSNAKDSANALVVCTICEEMVKGRVHCLPELSVTGLVKASSLGVGGLTMAARSDMAVFGKH